MNPRIVPMLPSHLDAAAGIERLCFTDPWSRAMLEDELENPLNVCLAALDGEALAGYASLRHILDEGHIHNVAVAPGYRRQGIGRALIREYLAYAGEHGLSFLMLEVRESNAAAIALYRGFGFEPDGRRPAYYRDPPEDALLMKLALGA